VIVIIDTTANTMNSLQKRIPVVGPFGIRVILVSLLHSWCPDILFALPATTPAVAMNSAGNQQRSSQKAEKVSNPASGVKETPSNLSEFLDIMGKAAVEVFLLLQLLNDRLSF